MAIKAKMATVLDLKGLDMVTPVDLLSNGRTPYSKNFRLYAQEAGDRRVAVSSRKGPGLHTTPIGETLLDSNTASTDASTAKVGVMEGTHLIPFTAASTSRITRFDIKVADLDNTGSGPLLVQLWSDQDNKPYKLLTESSILSGSIGSVSDYETARFINAYELEEDSKYWIVLHIQDDGKNFYDLSTTSDGTPVWKTDTTLFSAEEQDYSLNYRIYTTPSGVDKGIYRFNRDNGQNVTLVAFDDTLYRIDEAAGEFIKIIDGLSPDAELYSFTNADNKVFWANGYDNLTNWDGTIEEDADELVVNGSFNTDTSGWNATGGGTGNAITRSTSEYHSSPASLSITATSGLRRANQTLTLYKNRRYKVSYWVKGASASGQAQFGTGGSAVTDGTVNLTTNWQQVEFYWVPGDDVSQINLMSTSANAFFDDVSIIDTGIEYIIDTELPILSQIVYHKDLLFGLVANELNKFVYSQGPGDPAFDPSGTTPTTPRQQWYYAWLSTTFDYAPRPFAGSPITAIVSFQDSLTIFTQDNKYIYSGFDKSTFSLRQATGNKGALSSRCVISDENKIYFVSNDGLYEYNGSSDDKLSILVNPLLDGCPRKHEITPVLWKNQVRFYMASSGSTVNDICLIYDKDMKEMLLDTSTYINRAINYDDADDNDELIEFSSHVPISYMAEQQFNSLGAPIDFEYRLKYDSMGTPMQRKRLKRFYPILQGVDSTFYIQLAMDKDFEDSPKIKEQLLTTNGSKWGEFKWGDGTLYGGDKSFKAKRQSYSGYANYWQLRVMRKAVNNRVGFVGAQYAYKTKRL